MASPSRRLLRPALALLAVVVIGLLALAGVRLIQASRAGQRGQQELVQAVALMTPHNGFGSLDSATLDTVAAHITAAHADFVAMHHDLGGAGPAYTVARYIPFVRVQVRGVKAIDDAGIELSASATQLVGTAKQFLQPKDRATSLASGDVIGDLRTLRASAQSASTALDKAITDVATLNGYRLVGPLAHARATLVAKLPPLQQRATSARDALTAFITFAGGDGPRRYLVLSQNPDEVRPTGGYMGSYGVITAVNGHLSVTSYGDTNVWIAAHPQAVVPEADATAAIFHIANTDETLGDTNARPDWPSDAQLAMQLWRKGGEPSVDGVVSFTPDFLARLVAVLGPIHVPGFDDTVTGANLVDRTDYWTHHAPSQPVAGGRKEFLSVLAPLVMHKLVTTPSAQWPRLATAMADGFASQQAMVWSSDKSVQATVDAHHWAYALPQVKGDFYADSEFEFAAKNGRGLRRTFDHTVVLHADGSAKVTTVMTVRDTEPYAPESNPGSFGYVTPYGPIDASLDPTSTTPGWNGEPNIDGHPSAGWQFGAKPQSSATLKVGWDVPDLLQPVGHNRWIYQLTWLPTPSHVGDLVRLHFVLPAGWSWLGTPPPATLRPAAITAGHWMLQKRS